MNDLSLYAQIGASLAAAPVKKHGCILLLCGWDTAGRGRLIRHLGRHLDPRQLRVPAEAFAPPDALPLRGELVVLGRSWYDANADAASIRVWERLITSANIPLIKLFFHISASEITRRQSRRKKAHPDRVSPQDAAQAANYSRQYHAFDKMIAATDQANAPWLVLDADDREKCETAALMILAKVLSAAANHDNIGPESRAEAPLSKALFRAQKHMHRRGVRSIIMIESADEPLRQTCALALARSIDPRGRALLAMTVRGGTETPSARMNRLWQALPPSGHVLILSGGWARAEEDTRNGIEGALALMHIAVVRILLLSEADSDAQLPADAGWIIIPPLPRAETAVLAAQHAAAQALSNLCKSAKHNH